MKAPKLVLVSVASIAVLNILAAHSSASTQGIRGCNWADSRDNYQTGWVLVSGMSASTTSSQASSLASKVATAVKSAGGTCVRLPINPPTVSSSFWPVYQSAINTLLSSGVKVDLCYWIENKGGTIYNTSTWNAMWSTVNSAYGGNSNVLFEPINEPYGYSASSLDGIYASFISTYHCANWKCILDGTGYADHLSGVGSDSRLTNQYLGLHFYQWINSSCWQDYYNDMSSRVAGYNSRCVVTEMGANATDGANYYGQSACNLWGEIEYMVGASNYVYTNNLGSIGWAGVKDGDSYRWWNSSSDFRATNQSLINEYHWSWHL